MGWLIILRWGVPWLLDSCRFERRLSMVHHQDLDSRKRLPFWAWLRVSSLDKAKCHKGWPSWTTWFPLGACQASQDLRQAMKVPGVVMFLHVYDQILMKCFFTFVMSQKRGDVSNFFQIQFGNLKSNLTWCIWLSSSTTDYPPNGAW